MDGTGLVKGVGLVVPGPVDAKMNKTEAAYAELLEAGKAAGIVHEWYFQRVTLLLGPDLRYTPDFFLIHADGMLEFVEIKGFEREDSIVKFKMAAELHPWAHWTMMAQRPKKEGGGFEVTRHY